MNNINSDSNINNNDDQNEEEEEEGEGGGGERERNYHKLYNTRQSINTIAWSDENIIAIGTEQHNTNTSSTAHVVLLTPTHFTNNDTNNTNNMKEEQHEWVVMNRPTSIIEITKFDYNTNNTRQNKDDDDDDDEDDDTKKEEGENNVGFRANKSIEQYECSNFYRRPQTTGDTNKNNEGGGGATMNEDRAQVLKWSPLGVAVDGRSCLTVLTKANRVLLYCAKMNTALRANNFTTSEQQWPLFKDVTELLIEKYKDLKWKSLSQSSILTKGQTEEDVQKDNDDDEVFWKTINCFASAGLPKYSHHDEQGTTTKANNKKEEEEKNKGGVELLLLPQKENDAGTKDNDDLQFLPPKTEKRVAQLRKGSRCEVKRDSLESPWFTCTVLAAETDLFNRIRVQYDRKGMTNEWFIVSDIDTLEDETVLCGSTNSDERVTMKMKRWVRPSPISVNNELSLLTCPPFLVAEIYIGGCWQLVEIVDKDKVRFTPKCSPESVSIESNTLRKLRRWIGKKWEIIDDSNCTTKIFRLPTKKIEDEKEELGDGDNHVLLGDDDATKKNAASQLLVGVTKKVSSQQKKKKKNEQQKQKQQEPPLPLVNGDDDDYDDDDYDEDFDASESEEKPRKKRKKRGGPKQRQQQQQQKKKTTTSSEIISSKPTTRKKEVSKKVETKDVYTDGLTNATKVAISSCAWSPSFKGGILESILTLGTKNGECVFFRVGTKIITTDGGGEEPFCEFLGLTKAYFTPGVWVSAIDWMPLKDQVNGDSTWTCVTGSSSGEAKLFLCNPRLLCSRTPNAKKAEEWVVPSSNFCLNKVLIENADEIPITAMTCYRDQRGLSGEEKSSDVKVVVLGKASGEVLLFRSDAISSRIRLFNESIHGLAFQLCDVGVRVAVCTDSGRRADLRLLPKQSEKDFNYADDLIQFDFSNELNKDLFVQNGSIAQRALSAGGICASPNNLIIARSINKFDYGSLPSFRNMPKIKGIRGVLTLQASVPSDGSAITKNTLSLTNQYRGQSLWDCVELCSYSKTYWNAVAKWSVDDMNSGVSISELTKSSNSKTLYSLGSAYAVISALLRKNSSTRQPLPRKKNIIMNDIDDDINDDDNDELRILVHVNEPEIGWLPETETLQRRRRRVLGNFAAANFDCQVCGPIIFANGLNESRSIRADMRCETCGLLMHESCSASFSVMAKMV